MISVSARFEELRAKGQPALIPFITAGDPSLETTAKALRVLDQNGADMIDDRQLFYLPTTTQF